MAASETVEIDGETYPDPSSGGDARRIAERALRYATALAARETDRETAQDIAATVVVSMARHGLERFGDDGRLRGFVFAAVRYQLASFIRARQRQTEIGEPAAREHYAERAEAMLATMRPDHAI